MSSLLESATVIYTVSDYTAGRTYWGATYLCVRPLCEGWLTVDATNADGVQWERSLSQFPTEPTPADIRKIIHSRTKPVISTDRYDHRPALSAEMIARQILRHSPIIVAELLADWEFLRDATAAVERGAKVPGAWRGCGITTDVLTAATADVAATIAARRRAEEKAAAKAQREREKAAAAEKKRIESDPYICSLPKPDPGTTEGQLILAVRADPWGAAAGALYDYYQEQGRTPHFAAVVVARRQRYQQVRQIMESDAASAIRGQIRRQCGCGGANSVPIRIVGEQRSDEAPSLTGEAPSHTFKGGGACRNPGAAIRAGYKVEYHADTREITVGVAWLADLLRRELPKKAAGIVTVPKRVRRARSVSA